MQGPSFGASFPPELTLLIDTTNSGVTASDTVEIPFVGSYDNMDFGDGFNTGPGSGTTQHTYTVSGQHVVKITATTGSLIYNNGSDKVKLVDIQNWGSMVWLTMNGAFRGCTMATETAEDVPDTHLVTDFDSAARFAAFLSWPACDMTAALKMGNAMRTSKMTSYPLNDVPNCTAFNDCWRQTEIEFMPAIDVSSGENFLRAWADIPELLEFPLIDMPNADSCQGMFRNNTGLNGKVLPTYNLPLVDDFSDFLLNVTVTTQSYSDFLIALEISNSTVGTTFNGGGSMYNAAGETAKNALIADHSWTFIDGGLAP